MASAKYALNLGDTAILRCSSKQDKNGIVTKQRMIFFFVKRQVVFRAFKTVSPQKITCNHRLCTLTIISLHILAICTLAYPRKKRIIKSILAFYFRSIYKKVEKIFS